MATSTPTALVRNVVHASQLRERLDDPLKLLAVIRSLGLQLRALGVRSEGVTLFLHEVLFVFCLVLSVFTFPSMDF